MGITFKLPFSLLPTFWVTLSIACSISLSVSASNDGYAANRALDYLEQTTEEFGVDVVVAMQIYGEMRGSARAIEIAERRRSELRVSEIERYGVLLDLSKAPFDKSEIPHYSGSNSIPDQQDDLTDSRVQLCLDEVLKCNVSQQCLDYIELENRWGYVLTHQAVTLVFANWIGCPIPIDIDARRGILARNLIFAMNADPMPSDLASERIAMLGHLGFAHEINPEWYQALITSQRANGCFPLQLGDVCNPHSTALALWAFAHAP